MTHKLSTKKALLLTLIIALISLLLFTFIYLFIRSRSSPAMPSTAELFFNLNQSSYLPSTPVNFLIQAACTSPLTLTITKGQEEVAVFSTAATVPDPDIPKAKGATSRIGTATSGETTPPPHLGIATATNCSSTPGPSHTSSFTPSTPGTYAALLHDAASNTQVKSSFTVKDYTPIISRHSPTRITAGQRHPMVISLHTTSPLKGTLTDILPPGFTFAWHGQGELTDSGSSPTITWQVNLEANQTAEFTYEYTTDTPASLVTFGPAKINQSSIDTSTWHLIVAQEE